MSKIGEVCERDVVVGDVVVTRADAEGQEVGIATGGERRLRIGHDAAEGLGQPRRRQARGRVERPRPQP